MGDITVIKDAGNNRGLSDDQAAAMLGEGDLILTACPGSGKTRSIAARMAMLVSEGEALALVSYTNTGADEIARAAAELHGTRIDGLNFVGTLHSFIHKYLIQPFAHLLTGSVVPVRIDPDAVSELSPIGDRVHNYRYTVDGVLVPKGAKTPSAPADILAAQTSKELAASRGVVGYDDALHYSYRILQEFPNIARALAIRFGEIIVDEAQDSNEAQLAILSAIKLAGLKSLVLVGDYDQTIYSFGGSRPDLCQRLATELGLRPWELRENFRSSQILCNTTARFRQNKAPDLAVGKYAFDQTQPRILLYDPGSPEELPESFSRLLSEAGQPSSSVILVRSKALRARISGRPDIELWNEIEILIDAKMSESAPSLRKWRSLETMLLRCSLGGADGAAGCISRGDLRRYSVELVQMLPDLGGSIGDWAVQVLEVVDSVAEALHPENARKLARGRTIPQGWYRVELQKYLLGSSPWDVETIHSSKGTTVEAVMIVANEPSKPWMTSDAANWSRPLMSGSNSGASGPGSEELRIFYVGVTRAERSLVVALPNSTPSNLVSSFVHAGFSGL
ncbi:UvrD-helicase domain-containing protein [Rhodococcus erythropolis]|uniref:UvrD-helicase domain-containing protein n=1 Tax=Rhodococcus erythropolis TaxID=1833 RepID=UPI00379B5EA7